MEDMKEAFDSICEKAKDRKEEIDAERNDLLAERIGEALADAIRNGKVSDGDALNALAGELADAAEEAICENELESECGDYADAVLESVCFMARMGEISGVGAEDGALVLA